MDKAATHIKIALGIVLMAAGLYMVHPGFIVAMIGFILFALGSSEASSVEFKEVLDEYSTLLKKSKGGITFTGTQEKEEDNDK